MSSGHSQLAERPDRKSGLGVDKEMISRQGGQIGSRQWH